MKILEEIYFFFIHDEINHFSVCHVKRSFVEGNSLSFQRFAFDEGPVQPDCS